MSTFDDLGPQQTALLTELTRLCPDRTGEWILVETFADSELLALGEHENIADAPRGRGFYLELEQNGYLGTRQNQQGDLVIWPAQRAFEYVEWIAQPKLKRNIKQWIGELAGERPAWVGLVGWVAGILTTLFVQWVARLLGLS